jgi:hypothetical protein
MLVKIKDALSNAGAAGLAFAFFGLVIAGPFLVARVFPEQAYTITEAAGLFAVAAGLIALLMAIAPRLRHAAGVILLIGSWIVGAFLWVWSVLIVDGTWGLATIYIANFFFAVGAVIVAVAATLFTARWSVLWQMVVIGAIIIVMRVIGAAWAEGA